MSNIAGKSYAMNVITPLNGINYFINKIIFKVATLPFFNSKLGGLETLSLIHYARWVIIGKNQFPHLHRDQPKEDLNYNYMLFMSNFNGSWDQYVDSFSQAIPSGLDKLWRKNVKYPKSVPLQPFHEYINFNQIYTNHYYNAYPIASTNDVKAAKRVKSSLVALSSELASLSDQEFQQKYDAMLLDLQHDISFMKDTPVVSLSNQAVEYKQNLYEKEQHLKAFKETKIKKIANG